MAIDQALLESVQAGGDPALRFYRWSPACLSLGRNQSAPTDLNALNAAGLDLVRRPTGGLAVLHADELTYAVAVPVGAIGTPRQTYEAVNRGLLQGLSQLASPPPLPPSPHPSIPTSLPPASPAPSPPGMEGWRVEGGNSEGGSWKDGRKEGLTACFGTTAPGEVTAQGRKLIGSAQRYEKRSILQHGSILLGGDQSAAARLFSAPIGAGMNSITLKELLGRIPALSDLVAAFSAGLARELGICLAPATLSEAERARARELSAHFGSTNWTYRV